MGYTGLKFTINLQEYDSQEKIKMEEWRRKKG